MVAARIHGADDDSPPAPSRRGFVRGLLLAASGVGVASACSPPGSDRSPDVDPDEGALSARCPTVDRRTGIPIYGFAIATDPAFAGGADPTQHTDSSEAIRAAVASGKPVYIPPGRYLYLGHGIDHPNPVILGAGQGTTTVGLGPETYFIDSNQRWNSLELGGIRFDGGRGHVRNSHAGANVADLHQVHDCAFIGYRGCSISTNSVDHPYWKISNNVFHGVDYVGTIGIAMSGLSDGTTISDNAFLANRVHVKLSMGGNNTYIQNNDFLRFGPPDGSPRIDVWFVPAPSDTNAGGGMVITRCKFGNENLDPADLRIVYADQGTGSLISERWPVLDQPSAQWIAGHSVSEVFVNGIGDSVTIPLIRSTTANVVGGRYGPITLAGSRGAPVFSSINALVNGGASNQFGPLLRATSSTAPLPDLVVHD